MFKALVFDFDGLILDTETPEYNAWQEIYADYGRELSIGLWGQVIGGAGFSDFDAAGHLEQLTGHPVDREALNARQHRRSLELVAGQPILPGVLDYLNDARRQGLRLAVASSSPHSWVDAHLARLGLSGRFDASLCADDAARVKPHPDLFLAALSALHIRAEEAVALEDSPNGVMAAKAAGIRTVAVPNWLTRQLSIQAADVVLDSLADLSLADLLKQLGDPCVIRRETPADLGGIRRVNVSAFGQANEADLVDLMRARGKAALSLVAVNGGHVLGHLLFSPVTIAPQPPGTGEGSPPNMRGLGLGPVAVLPEYQRTGIGSRLIRAGLQMCREQGYGFVVLLGDPAYYSRFGFIPGREFGLVSDYGEGDEFQACELRPGVLQGIAARVKYPGEFTETGC